MTTPYVSSNKLSDKDLWSTHTIDNFEMLSVRIEIVAEAGQLEKN